MYKKNNISFLVLALPAFLLYPDLIKLAHVHHHSSATYTFSGEIALNQQEEPCPVCTFEFVSFISDQKIEFTFRLPQIAATNSRETEIPEIPATIYFSLRAPPLA